MERDLQHLPFDVGGDNVPEGGERTHVQRWSGQNGGYRGAGALDPGAVDSRMGGRAEKKWDRGEVGGAAEAAMVGFFAGKGLLLMVRLWLARGGEGGAGDSRA